MLVVTGPTGNVGAQVADRLMTESHNIPFRVAAHNPARLKKKYGEHQPVVKFDYGDRSTWDAVLQNVETLFLLFPLPHPRTVHTWMKPFIDAAVKAGAKRIIYVSVPGSDTKTIVPHYKVERHIEASGLDYTFLRATFFMQNLCRGITTHGVDTWQFGQIFIPAKNGTTTFIDSRDVAQVVLDILKNPAPHKNKSYLLTGPENLDFYQVAEQMTEVFQKPIRYTNPSMPHFWWRMLRRGVKWDIIFFMTMVYMLTRSGNNKQMSNDLEQLLGRPPTKMRQFLAENKWRWEQSEWT
ncbi:MAG: SDR family oxidoreductase [Gammaproteobacteria bacterium]|nr:SDR family oxidoreductase [Gammaproteobacteria bacterium]